MYFKKWLCVGLLSASLFGLCSAVSADDFAGVKSVKAVWNITTGDEKIFLDRMDLIQQTADSLKKRGIKADFVLIIHGPAAKFVAKDLKGTKFAKDKVQLKKDHETLQSLSNNGMPVEVCAIALKRGKIEHSNVGSFAVIQDNVFENLISLQNQGYAYMSVP